MDVLVVTRFAVNPGSVVRCRALGMLVMEDEAGGDAKLLAVTVDKILAMYSHWKKIEDVNPQRLATIQHFFEHYKDLEKGKWVTIVNWVGPEKAERMIIDGIRRAAQSGDDVAAHHIAAAAMQKRAARRKS